MKNIVFIFCEIYNIRRGLLAFQIYFNQNKNVSDAPICSTEREEVLGGLKHETLTLKCEVDSSPPAESFHWTFNSSGEQTELPSRLHSSEVRNWIKFTFQNINK